MNQQGPKGRKTQKVKKTTVVKPQQLIRSQSNQSKNLGYLMVSTSSRTKRDPPFLYGIPSKPKCERSLTVLPNNGLFLLAPGKTSAGLQASAAASFFALINPTNALIFPQLANTAINFNRYRFTSLGWRYLPNQSGQADSNKSGTTSWTFNPDSLDPFYDDPATVSTLQTVQKSSWEQQEFHVPKEQLAKIRYCGVNGIPSGGDPHEYYVGSFQGGVFGNSSNTGNLGFVEFFYSVELLDPINSNPTTHGNSLYPVLQSNMFRLTANSSSTNTGGTVVMDGTKLISMLGSTQSRIVPDPISTSTLQLPQGNWNVRGFFVIEATSANDYFTYYSVQAVFNGGSQRLAQFNAADSGANYQSGPKVISIPFESCFSVEAGGLNLVGHIILSVIANTKLGGDFLLHGSNAPSTNATSQVCVMPMA